MKPIGNRKAIRFEPATSRASKTVRSMIEAGLEAQKNRTLDNYVVGGTVRMAEYPEDPCMSPYGTDDETARQTAERRIAELRHDAQQMENRLRAYGPQAFIVDLKAVESDTSETTEELLNALTRGPWTHIQIAGRLFTRQEIPGYPLIKQRPLSETRRSW